MYYLTLKYQKDRQKDLKSLVNRHILINCEIDLKNIKINSYFNSFE